MGVYIRAKKPIKFLMTEEEYNNSSSEEQKVIYDNDKAFCLYTLKGFEPTEHLTQFQWGYWECETPTDNGISLPYSTWGSFRTLLASLVDENYTSHNYWLDNGTFADKPFYEIINFADNEGCFDYKICEELIKDFEQFYDKAQELYNKKDTEWNWYLYKSVMQIIQDCIECKGVVYYS